MVSCIYISKQHTRFTLLAGVLLAEGMCIDGVVYELDHVVTDAGQDYAIGFVRNWDNLLASCNGRLVPDNVVVWRCDHGHVTQAFVRTKWSEWTTWSAERHKMPTRARAAGDPGIRVSVDDGIVRKGIRENRIDEEERNEAEESEEEEEDGEDDDVEEEEYDEKDVEVRVE